MYVWHKDIISGMVQTNQKEGFSMRTLTMKDETEYEILRGEILLKLRAQSVEPDMPAIKRAIQEIAVEFPWRNGNGTGAINDYSVSDGEIIQDNFDTRQKVMRFRIQHDEQHLRRGQIYAYEKHLAKIAQELAKRTIYFATSVHDVIEVRMWTSFLTGEPQ